jgi:hypothetical protein
MTSFFECALRIPCQIHSTMNIRCFYEDSTIISYGYTSNSTFHNKNSIIAVNKLKLAKRFEKIQKFHTKQSLSSIAYTKYFEVKPQHDS